MSHPSSFGQWVKQRRKALDLTQAALAREANCSLSAIEKIEANRRRPTRVLAERLADILAIGVSDRPAFLSAARRSELTTDASASGNLPIPPTPFIGRERESAILRSLLRQTAVRLLTLTGTGGIGKTRLALHVSADLKAEFPHGIYFVPLETIHHPDRVVSAIAQALEVQEVGSRPIIETLKERLHDQSLLLLLDNFEYVLEAAPLLADILAATLRLKILVTSRAALQIEEEHELVVPSLELPNIQRLPSVSVLAQNAAVALFTIRAQKVSEFTLTRANASVIAEICVRLEGLPLAIELAAARNRLFTPQTLLARLSQRLTLALHRDHDYARAQQLYTESLALERQQDNRVGIADSLMNLGYALLEQGDYAGAQPFYEESLSIHQELGNTQGIAHVLMNLGLVATQGRDYARAARYLTESYELFASLGNKLGQGRSLAFLAEALLEQGNYEQAARYCKMSLVLRQELGSIGGMSYCFDLLARLANAQTQPLRAAHLYGALQRFVDATDFKRSPAYNATFERYLSAARAQVAPAAWDEAWAGGEAIPLEEVIAFALNG